MEEHFLKLKEKYLKKSIGGNMSREKKLAKNSIILLIGQVIPKLTFFVVLPILTACLTKTEYGTYDLISVLQSLLIPIITLQIQVAGFRYLIENKDDLIEKRKIVTNIFLFLIPDILILFVGVFFALFKYAFSIRILISTFLVFELIYNVFGQIARGLLDTKGYSLAGIINAIINMFLTILLIYFLRLGLNGLVLCLCISVLIPSLILFKREKMYSLFDYKLRDKTVLKKLLEYSWPMIPLAISMWIINASDRLMITIFLGVEANAVYAVARKIPNIINLVQSSFHTAWTESASLADKDEDSSEYYSKTFDTLFRAVSGMTMVVSCTTPILFLVLIRGSYEDAYFQMPILLLSMVFFSLSSFMGGIYTAKKKTKSVGFTTIWAAFINIAIDYLLIGKIGIYAASISTLISYMALSLFRMKNVKTFVDIKYDIKNILLMILITTISCSLLYVDNIYIKGINILFSMGFAIFFNKNLLLKLYTKFKNKILKNQN